jgi:hypothetical protein
MQPASRASSFRFQHIGTATEEGNVRAYGPNVAGVSGGKSCRRTADNADLFVSSSSRTSSREATDGLNVFENRWWIKKASIGARVEMVSGAARLYDGALPLDVPPCAGAFAVLNAASAFFLSCNIFTRSCVPLLLSTFAKYLFSQTVVFSNTSQKSLVIPGCRGWQQAKTALPASLDAIKFGVIMAERGTVIIISPFLISRAARN